MGTTHVETGTGLFKSNHCSSYQKNDNSVWDRKRIPCQIPFFSPQINCIQDLLPPPTNHPRGNSHPITLPYLLYIFTSKWVMHSLFAGQNMLLHVFLFCTFFYQKEVKICRPALWCKQKKTYFFAKFCCKFLAFFQLFSTENAENDYLDQRLEFAAPKRWSKYTTHAFPLTLNVQDNWTKII